MTDIEAALTGLLMEYWFFTLATSIIINKTTLKTMASDNSKRTKIYFGCMCAYWLVFGLITIFYPKMMDIFQTQAGVGAKTIFSNHVWLHGGFDILALCVLLFVLAGESVSRNLLRATAVAALMPTIAIFWSLVSTSFWNPLFIGAGLGCFAFVVWGFVLAAKAPARKQPVVATNMERA